MYFTSTTFHSIPSNQQPFFSSIRSKGGMATDQCQLNSSNHENWLGPNPISRVCFNRKLERNPRWLYPPNHCCSGNQLAMWVNWDCKSFDPRLHWVRVLLGFMQVESPTFMMIIKFELKSQRSLKLSTFISILIKVICICKLHVYCLYVSGQPIP